MPAGMMQACHIQVMPACCRNSSMACKDTSEPCTSYSSMYSKQAEYLHAGVVVDMQRHHRDNYIILYTASDQKYSESKSLLVQPVKASRMQAVICVH